MNSVENQTPLLLFRTIDGSLYKQNVYLPTQTILVFHKVLYINL